MFPHHSLVALCLASPVVEAVFHRRGSANQSAPCVNFTRTRPLPASPIISVETLVVTPLEVRLQSASSSIAGASSEYEVLRPTDTTTFEPPNPSNSSYSTSSVTDGILNTTLSSPGGFPSAASDISPFSSNSTTEFTTRTSNATCTVNIPNASLDYWFKPTYSHVVATLTTAASDFTNALSYTLVPRTTTFNAASALESDFVCTYTESYYSEFDFTLTMCEDYTVIPTAASTSIIYRSDGYSPFPSDGVIPISDVRLYDLYLPDSSPSATAIVTLAPNVTRVQTSATPFVYFTAYEVETDNKTETVQLPSAQAYPYWLRALEDKDTATGLLPQGFLEQVPHSACDAGQLQAVVIVLIIVDIYYHNLPNLEPALIHFESSVLGFEDPPFVVNDWRTGISRTVPITVADWSIPVDPKPTSASVRSTHLPELVPATRDRGGPMQSGFPQSRPPPVLTIGFSTITPNAATQFFIAPGQTLTPGGVVTVDGTAVSLAPSASFIVIGGSTQVFLTGPALLPTAIQPSQIVVGDATVTAQVTQNKPNFGPTFVISGQTLLPGGPVVNFSGNTISLEPSGGVVVINGASSTMKTQAVPAFTPSVITVGNDVFSLIPDPPKFVIGGQTLSPGGPAITASDTTLSLAPSASFLLVNGATSVIADAISSTITVGDSTLSPLPRSSVASFAVCGQILAPGSPAITISDTVLSLGPSASFIVVNGATSTLELPALQASPPSITIGNEIFSALSELSGSAFIIADQTLVAGDPEIVVSGMTLSLASSASFVVVNGATSTLTNPDAPHITAPPLTIGDVIFRPLPGTGTAYLIRSILLTAGGSIVVSGATISLATGATALVINGQTSLISPQVQPAIMNPPRLTIGTETYTAMSGSGTTFVIGTETLTPGGTITIDGTTISLAAGATELIYGSSGRSTTTALSRRPPSILLERAPERVDSTDRRRRPVKKSARQRDLADTLFRLPSSPFCVRS